MQYSDFRHSVTLGSGVDLLSALRAGAAQQLVLEELDRSRRGRGSSCAGFEEKLLIGEAGLRFVEKQIGFSLANLSAMPRR